MRSEMRRAFALLAPGFVAVLAVAVPARADGPEPGERPPFGGYDVAIAEGGLPQGWKATPVGTPSEAGAAILAELKTIGEATKTKMTTVERGATTADGKAVTFVLVDAEDAPLDVAKALEEAAGKKGWSFRTLGSAWRLLVVAGPEDARKAGVEAQVAFAAKMLAIKAESAWEVNNGERAIGFAKGAAALDPKSSSAHAVLGVAGHVLASRQVEGYTQADAIKHLRAAFEKDAHDPVKDVLLVRAKGALGSALLQSNDAAQDKEARAALKDAVAAAKDSKDVPRDMQMEVRYNLACAHSRLKELDEAFALLGGVLEENAKETVNGVDEIWREKDTDLANMRADPRWKPLLDKYGKEGGGGGDMGGGK